VCGGTPRARAKDAPSGSLVNRYFFTEARASVHRPMGRVPLQANGQLLLVVDDQVLFTTFLREKFEEMGYSVLTAGDVGTARELVRRFEVPLVILLDLMMPRVSGYQLLLELADSPHASRIRVVLVSAHHSVATLAPDLPMVMGRSHKPVDLGELTRLVDMAALDLRSDAAPQAHAHAHAH
jgi:CheY-like chemotaxis protein